jgi:protein subunit release factor B
MDMRTVIKHTSKSDVAVKMMDLKKGDVFTLKESDTVVVGKFEACDTPYLNEAGIATIMCNPI